MATISVGGALVPSTKDTPIDARTRVQTVEDIKTIANPYQGMRIFVIEKDETYVVTQLQQQKVGIIATNVIKTVEKVPDQEDIEELRASLTEQEQELQQQKLKLQQISNSTIFYQIMPQDFS